MAGKKKGSEGGDDQHYSVCGGGARTTKKNMRAPASGDQSSKAFGRPEARCGEGGGEGKVGKRPYFHKLSLGGLGLFHTHRFAPPSSPTLPQNLVVCRCFVFVHSLHLSHFRTHGALPGATCETGGCGALAAAPGAVRRAGERDLLAAVGDVVVVAAAAAVVA